MEENADSGGEEVQHHFSFEVARAAGDDELMDSKEQVCDAIRQGMSPRRILQSLLGADCPPPEEMDNGALWRLLASLLMTPEPRNRLLQYNTVDRAVKLISDARNIIVLTGAGISVSCGIPDFRSPQGLYATLHRDFPELSDPQTELPKICLVYRPTDHIGIKILNLICITDSIATELGMHVQLPPIPHFEQQCQAEKLVIHAMFDIRYFKDDPTPFFRFCKEIYPGQFTPSPSHYFIAALEQKGKLLRHYTQNIDTLEHTAGISRVVYCHGSFATASCCRCKHRVDCDAIREDVMKQQVPMCPKCEQDKVTEGEDEEEEDILSVMKPDIVFFGEGLPDEFHHALEKDKTKVDLLIVMGSSLKVRPVALIPSVLDQSVPQLLINRETLPHMTFDIQMLGYSDTVIRELCRRLGDEWVESVGGPSDAGNASFSSPMEHVHLFQGAVWKPSGCETLPHVETEPNQTVLTSETKLKALSITSEPNHKMTTQLNGKLNVELVNAILSNTSSHPSSSNGLSDTATTSSKACFSEKKDPSTTISSFLSSSFPPECKSTSTHARPSLPPCSSLTSAPTIDDPEQPLPKPPPSKRLKVDHTDDL